MNSIYPMAMLLLLFACAQSPAQKSTTGKTICLANLSEQGEKVVVVRELAPESTCRSLGDVVSTRCHGEGQTQFHLNGLKNAAAILGADHVMLLPQEFSHKEVKGRAYVCRLPKLVPIEGAGAQAPVK